MRPQSVPVNVYETPAALVVLAPVPAVTATDVTIEVRPGTVRFWARLRSAGPREYLMHEWEYGCYERQIDLPAGFGRGWRRPSPTGSWRSGCCGATTPRT